MWTGENDKKTINADANFFENGAKTAPFSFENGVSVDGTLERFVGVRVHFMHAVIFRK